MKKSVSLYVLLTFIMLDIVYGVGYLAASAINPKIQEFRKSVQAQSLVISGNTDTAIGKRADSVAANNAAGDAYRTAASQAEDVAIDKFYEAEGIAWDINFGGS